MIPRLLWRCPICHTDDALYHKTHWFKPDRVYCTDCATGWELQRVIGSDYILKVVAGETPWRGQGRPLGVWYDAVKASARLVPLRDAPIPLLAGESLYLKSKRVKLVAAADTFLFKNWHDPEAPTMMECNSPAPPLRRVGWGQLSMTNERLCWTGAERSLTFWVRRVSSAFIRPFSWLVISYGENVPYWFHFQEESGLKWLTYLHLVANRVEEQYGHHISLPPY